MRVCSGTALEGMKTRFRDQGRTAGVGSVKMVYRGGRGSRIDDECASPFSDDSGLRSGDLDHRGRSDWDGAFRWSGRVGKGDVGVRGRRYWQGDLGAENTDRAGRYHRTSDLARHDLRSDRDRGRSAVALASQCVDGGRPAGDL